MKFLLDNPFTGSTTSASYLDQLFFKLSIEGFPSNYFIEAGAFDADTSLTIKNALPFCKIFAFEANPYNYNHFKENLVSINYNNLAISNKSGMVDFNVMLEKKSQKVDLIRMDNSITPRNKKGIIYKQVAVPCISIDEYFNVHTLSNVSLWVDVEGHGLECLEGAVDTLQNVNIIKIEVEDKQYWKNQKLSADITNFLIDKHFIPVVRDFQSPMQYNILFVKDRLTTTETFKKCCK